MKWSETVKGISGKVGLEYDAQDDAAADIAVDPETGELIQPLTGDIPPPDEIPPPSEDDYPGK